MNTQLIGPSPAIRQLMVEIDGAARSDAKVFISGETGVGKELVARLLHERSNRALRPFLTVNCAGLPDSLLESELFGLVSGSFTAAYRDKKGRLEQAAGGTIFLDEVGELSLRMQAVLLRFLETGELKKVGSDDPVPVDVRVIAATCRHLPDMVREKTFREDLYYRLNVIHLEVPALRERRSDIPVLFKHFWANLQERHHAEQSEPRLGPGVLEALVEYSWPGNVRELENLAERLFITTQKETLKLRDLPRALGGDGEAALPLDEPAPQHVGGSGASDFEVVFSEEFSPSEIKELLTAFANYYRACGGLGFDVKFEAEEVPAREPVDA